MSAKVCRQQVRRSVHTIESLEQRLFLSTTVLTADLADNGIDNNGTTPLVSNPSIRVGDNGTNATERNAVFPFLLPSLPTGAIITGVTANFYLESLANGKKISGNLDLYGLGRRSSATVLAQDYYRGAYGGDATDATAIQGTLATKSTPVGNLSLNASGQANLLSYINTQYASGAGSSQYVFLRLSHQAEQGISRYWLISSADNATAARRPTLTITYDVPVNAPNPASNLAAATTGSDSVQLTWQDNSSNETGFRIERSTDGVNFTPHATVAAGVTSHAATGLSADTKYTFRVYAVNGATSSTDPSNTAAATTLPVFTTTRWVDVNYTGATANGAFATPYKTIAAAMTAATSGDGVVLRGGTYREAVTMKAGVTLMGLPGERAVVSGFAEITGWTLHAGNTYKTTLAWRPTTLYVGYDPMDVSREPDAGWWTAPTVTQGTGTTTITDATHLAGIDSLVGGSIQAHTASGNNWASGTITAHDTVAGTVTFNAIAAMANNDYYLVKNTLNLLDNPGEWAVLNNGDGTYTLFFNPNNVADLASTQARKLTGQQIRASSTGSNSTIRNVEVTGNTGYGINIGGSTASRAVNVTVRDVIVHNNGSTGVWSRYAANTVIRNSIVMANGSTGIAVISTKTALVDQNEVAWNGNDGIVVAGDVSGKLSTDPAFDPSDSVTVSNNYIHDHNGFTHSDGIQMYRWPTNTKIYNNYITRASQGIMTEEVASAELVGNVIWNTAAYNVIFGHANSKNWLITNNTIGGAGYGPFNWDGQNYQVYENVFNTRFTVPSTAGFNYQGDRNLFWANGSAPLRRGTSTTYTTISAWNTATGQDANSVIGDPQFNNVAPIATVIDNVLLATTTSMKVRSVSGFAVGDYIQINGDGVVRTVTAVDVAANRLTWDIALPMQPLSPHVTIENFKTSTNFAVDVRLRSTSPGYTMSSTGGPIGGTLSTIAYVAGDYNNDGLRDIPLLDSGIIAGLPGANGWVPNSGI